MSDEKDKVSTSNQIPIDKEEQKAELKAATDVYEQRCLLSLLTVLKSEITPSTSASFHNI